MPSHRRGLPCILVIGEAALAADLVTGLIIKHLERNLALSKDGILTLSLENPSREAALAADLITASFSQFLATLAAQK